MTVKRMKELLNHMPDNAEIVYWDGDAPGGWMFFTDVEYSEKLCVSGWRAKPEYKYGKFVKLND